MNKQDFLEKYSLTESDLAEADISWDELDSIARKYQEDEQTLRDCGKSFIDEYLYDIEKAGNGETAHPAPYPLVVLVLPSAPPPPLPVATADREQEYPVAPTKYHTMSYGD